MHTVRKVAVKDKGWAFSYAPWKTTAEGTLDTKRPLKDRVGGGAEERTWLELVHQLYNQCKLDEAHRSNFGLRWLLKTLTPGGVVDVYSHWYINRRDKFLVIMEVQFIDSCVEVCISKLKVDFMRVESPKNES